VNHFELPQNTSPRIRLSSSVSKVFRAAVTTDKERITIYLPTELKNHLTELAKADRRSMTTMIEVLLLEALQARQNKKTK
jgi:hypothetical protein